MKHDHDSEPTAGAGSGRLSGEPRTPGWIVGLDIGGTFTDVVMVHPGRPGLKRFKCLTTPEDPAEGALAAITGVLEVAQARPQDIAVVLHATTLASNALIERKGATTALVSTRGFRDVLRIGREKKFDIYDLQIERPEPLVPERLSFEVNERVGPDGRVVEPLDEASVGEVAEAIRAGGADAVAVCLLHSYMNAAHEQRVRELLHERLGPIAISLSSEVLPELREFERASTTAANAFVQPVIATYLQRFVDGLALIGVDAALFIMLSEGGMASPDVVRRLAVRICESGPAAGAVTAASVATQCKLPRVLSFDMGGTTAKTSLIHDGEPEVTMDFEVARMYRFKKGSGLPLRMPVVDLIEIGAGGGSIVRVDELGLIKVGPDSVGADPGPACYGRGGTQATVTDADLVLGYLDPASFLGGRMRLDAAAAGAAIAASVANPLGLPVTEAALAVHAIVNENMANAARVQAVERGHDPSGYSLVAFGGAGPVHASGVAKRLRLRTIIVPPTAGLGSAVGLMLAPRTFRLSRTHIGTLDSLDWRRIEALFDEIGAEAAEALRRAGVSDDQMRFRRSADMRYLGQRKELIIDLPAGSLRRDGARALRTAFEAAYRRVYHRIHADHPVEAIAWRLAASGPPIRRPDRAQPRRAKTRDADPSGRRPMLFPGWQRHRASPVFSRYDLSVGDRVRGPAVIEEAESTTVIAPGYTAVVDPHSNLVVTLPKEPQ
jgi:N-methylhydantoinase A/oxoprolinase/acetone carboxylase beta subunit